MPISKILSLAPLALAMAACQPTSNPGPIPSPSTQPSPSVSPTIEPSPTPSPIDGASVAGNLLVVEQFGYLPDYRKSLVLRNPQQGYDSDLTYQPSSQLHLIDLDTNEVVLSAAPQSWNNGATHSDSGDQVWLIDFSDFKTPGRYQWLDPEQGLASYPFSIDAELYRTALREAFRTFFYQRAGQDKLPPHVPPAWSDTASHLGPGQATQARLYGHTNDANTERDLRGGWYDAGDLNIYTNWHAVYLNRMLHAYLAKPAAWGDDFGIPESNNGIADLIDEWRWGMDWLQRMQNQDGSVLSVLGNAHASPPSAASGPSVYGPASTSATLSAAAAFAFGSLVLADQPQTELKDYADKLAARAKQAWQWAQANPNVIFNNSGKVAAGEQEVNDYGRVVKSVQAAIYLYALTQDSQYSDFVRQRLSQINMMNWQHVYPYEPNIQRDLLYFASLLPESDSDRQQIHRVYRNSMTGFADNWPAIRDQRSPYGAHLKDYTWGSNSIKSAKGLMYYDALTFGVDLDLDELAIKNAALGYIQYIHGINPLAKMYLTNMAEFGATDSADSFYHTWFHEGSELWSSVKESTYGPAPGFLVGGPNPQYNVDSCCPSSCGSAANNLRCTLIDLEPPRNQPNMKSYKDFNHTWPINSWEVTENMNDYQLNYIRLLVNFVD